MINKRLMLQVVIDVIQDMEGRLLKRIINKKEQEQFTCIFIDGAETTYTYTFISLAIRAYFKDLA